MQRLGDIPLDICNPSDSSDRAAGQGRGCGGAGVQSADNRDVPCHPFPEYLEMHRHRITVSSSSLELQYFLSRLGRKLWLSGQISLDVCILLAF